MGLQIGHQPHRQREGDDADRNVDVEDPVPALPVDQHTAQNRADQGGQTGYTAPQAHGRAALVRREGTGDDGHGLWCHERRAQALDRAGGDQHLDRTRGRTPQRGQGEDRQTGQIDVLGAEPIAQPSGDQQRHRVGEQIGAGHPDDLVHIGVQVLQNRRIGHRDDGHIQQDHEEPDYQREQRQPRISLGCHRFRSCSRHRSATDRWR